MLPKLSILAGLAAVAASFTIPEGSSDGLYIAYHDAQGNEVHKAMTSILRDTSSLTEASKRDVMSLHAARGQLSKRQTWCGCGHSSTSAFMILRPFDMLINYYKQ